MAETTTPTFDAATYTANGTARDRVPLPATLFDGTVNVPVMHQAVQAFLANQRQGNASTKTRGLVTGGNQKPWKQKGTGRARQGSTRAPHWVGGGTVFGPHPRSYAQYVPKQVRALARKSAFNARAREGAVIVVDQFAYDAPKTSRLAAMLARVGAREQKVLILTDGVKPNVYLSGRNLPSVQVLPYSDVSTYHILWSDVVVIEAPAIGHVLEPVADTEATEVPRPTKRKSARAERAAAGEGAAPRKGATKKGASRKSASKKGASTKAESRGARAKSTSARKTSTQKKSAGKKTSSAAPKKKKGK
jgi:large subunit ribosomal protein L4